MTGRATTLVRTIRRWRNRAGTDPVEVTREAVEWAYRILLEREPEDERVVLEKIVGCETIADLREQIMLSREFRNERAGAAYLGRELVVIKEFDDGFRLHLDLSDLLALEMARGVYETAEISFARSVVRPGSAVLDLGSHMGFFTFTMAGLVGPSGSVHCFEPLAENADLIERSIAENGLQDVVTLHRCAVGAAAGRVHLVRIAGEVNRGIAHVRGRAAIDESIHELRPVDVVRLDDLDLPRPVNFVKMDIEGAEPLAVEGAAALLARDRPVVLSELNEPQLKIVAGCAPGDFIAQMRTLGYTCRRLRDDGPAEPVTGSLAEPVASVVFTPDRRWAARPQRAG